MSGEAWWRVGVPVSPGKAEEAAADLAQLAGRGAEVIPDGCNVWVVVYLPAHAPVDKFLRLWAAGERWASGDIIVQPLVNKDWLTWWRRDYRPFRVGERLVVKPTWCSYSPDPREVVIELDPGLAFGCGTHPSTCLCLRLLERHLRPGAKVYDVGTGSGILAIAAARLGASSVVAIDEDEVALRVAQENVLRNRVAERVRVLKGDLLAGQEEKACLIVANLTVELLQMLWPAARDLLVAGGIFIASGIPVEREEEALPVFVGATLEDREEDSGWVGLVWRA
ncbi:50S ribosomal protein L11 methyltransferase [Desulfothermobacter acidiphilus]|uniref:50S ribosomal protein L11 methyltransferase n=1 Tax=Desulfothermobacter acidiphilus TaxID=1938353 RepID=UPI003F8B450A